MARRRAIATGAAAGAAAGALALRRRRGAWQEELRYRLDGLDAPVHVTVDEHGVPHVRARGLEDAVYALGVLHARQRLWQMELLRRVVRGTLAELVGGAALETDRYARVLGLGRAADASAASATPAARAFAEAYCRGVNACVAAGALHWPLELKVLLQRSVAPWTPGDCHAPILLFALSLGQNFEAEIVRARLAEALGAERLAELEGEPPVAGPTVLPRAAAEAAALAARAREAAGGGPAAGSNCFAVAASRSATGSALLANDPHLVLGLPGAWFVADLAWDDGRVSGFTVAGLPGVVAGRTAGVAWGVTNGMVDTQDLFAVDVAPHRVERLAETIRVRGRRRPHVEEVQRTGDGPIVTPVAPGETRALALRWTALERPLTLEPLLRAAHAQTGPELVAAFAGLVGPILNVAWADRDGRVGYKLVGGPVPLRARGDGRVPLDAGAGAGWRGTVPDAELPGHADPADGLVVTANNRIAADPYPHFLSAEWLPPYRAERIAALLAEAGPLTVADLTRIQVDVRSLPGLRLREIALRRGPAGSDAARRAHGVLAAWDGELTVASAGGAVYGALLHELAHEVFAEAGAELERFLGAVGFTELSSTLGFYGRHVPRVLDLLDAADDGFFRDGRTWEGVWERCLERAAATLAARLGDDPAGWRWGDLHVLVLDHPLAALSGVARVVRRGPYPLPGDADTVWQARQPPSDPVTGTHTTGPGMRYATDLGDPDASRFVLCGGQSGHPGSPAYADQVDDWLAGRTRPLHWSDDAIAAAARSSIELVPRPPA